MTTFQDPPPQSRRSARQNERSERPDDAAEFNQFPPAQPPFLGQQVPGHQQPQQQTSPAPTGRRARSSTSSNLYEVAPEPLNYSTQGAQPPVAGYAAPNPAEPAQFRVRDFSPEGSGRRAAVPPLVEPNAPSSYPRGAHPAGASDLDYRTQGAPSAYVPPGVASEPVAHQTLSRREVRQRQEAAAANAATQAAPAQYPSPLPSQQAAPVQFPQQYTPQPPVQQAPPAGYPTPAALSTAPPPTALRTAKAEFEALTRSGQVPPPTVDQRAMPAEPHAAPAQQTGGWVAPVGHWSRQADLDDETQPWENTITREVGGGNVATTTSALVLPQIPRADPFATALNSTGEVLLTGSIDLPRSLSSTGSDGRHYDDPRVDHMFDTQDAEFTGTDSSPVRATRAVSTHTSARGVIHANKAHGNRLIIVVFVATAVLAVGVVTMLVVSLASGLF